MRRALGFGLRLIAASKMRLAAAAAGLGMAVAIMFVELGLFYGILDSQALVAIMARGDLIAMHRERTNLHLWNRMVPIRIAEIAASDEVAKVVPVYESTVGLRDPETLRIHRIAVFAFPPETLPLAVGPPEALAQLLRMPNGVLFDRRSRPIFGNVAVGRDVELDDVRQRVIGYVDLGPDVVLDGAVVMSEGAWLARTGGDEPIMASIWLNPGIDPVAAQRHLAAVLPADVAVLTPDEVRTRENLFTLHVAPIGILFGVGMLAGLIIASVTCYQVLFNEVTDRIRQYAMLKAMGFSDGFLLSIVLGQAAFLCAAGFLGGAATAVAVERFIARSTQLAVGVSGREAMLVLALSAAMCAGAAWLAVKRALVADPAALY
jgi:putative ABC transport system permease protein